MAAVISTKAGAGANQTRHAYSFRPCLASIIFKQHSLKFRAQQGVKRSAAAGIAVQDAVTAELLQWMQQKGCTLQGVALKYEDNHGQLSRELRAAKVCC
jgi:hypothetical protein